MANLTPVSSFDPVRQLEGTDIAQPSTFNGQAQALLNRTEYLKGQTDFKQAGTGAVARTAQDKMREVVSLNDFGAVGDAVTNNTSAFNNARTSSGGAYSLGRGVTYVVDASPNVFADRFYAPASCFIKIGGTTYDVSNTYSADSFRAGVDGTKAYYRKAGMHINKMATGHAHYGVLDDTTYDFTGSSDPLIGSASYNDNTLSQGNLGFDHHHSFQSYAKINLSSGTVGVLSSFWSLLDVTAGTVSQASGVKINNPAGSGTISTLYGVLIENLTRASVASNNWGIFSKTANNFLGNKVYFGDTAGNSYTHVGYDPNLGHTVISPRTGYAAKIVGAAGDRRLRLGTADNDVDDAWIENAGNGDFELRQRAGGPYSVSSLGPFKMPAYTVATLTAGWPAANAPYARAFVTDATATTFNSIVAGGGANKVPVWSDGTNWRIG
jgi:hypothetical protein